jgi:predicted secreted protein
MGIRKQLLALLFGVDVALIEKLERKLAKQAVKGSKRRKTNKKSKGKGKGKKAFPTSSDNPLPATTPEQEAARIEARASAETIDKKGAP